MDKPGGHYAKWNKTDTEKYVEFYKINLSKAESSLVVTRGWRMGKNKEMMKGYKALVI